MMQPTPIRYSFAAFILCWTCAFAAPPVLRQSDDRDADLIDALILTHRFEEAESICRWNLSRHQKTSDQYSLAATRLAKVMIAKQIAAGAFNTAAVKIANQPVDRLLAEYPDTDRKLFLEASKISVRQLAVQMDVAGAAIREKDRLATQPAMARLTRLTRDAETLIDRIRESIPADTTLRKDLQRLEQELLVATVSMALMQTELFTTDSDDAIAAATAAVEAAEQAQLILPQESQAANEIQRMRITAVLRSGDAELAFTELRRQVERTRSSPSPKMQALQIEVLLAKGRSKEAGRILKDNLGESRNQNEASIPMDLAQLRYLLATDQTDAAAKWIGRIGDRHGLYARRLAEAIVISTLDRSLTAPGPASTQAALIETRGRQLIRDGETAEGGRMLARAAISQLDPERAIEISIAAAAALKNAGHFQACADTLTSVAQKHPDAAKAPSLDLQAILMMTSGSKPASTQQIENRLRHHLENWPESDVAPSARKWLIELLVARNANIDAAVIATSLTPAQMTVESVDKMVGQWELAFQKATTDDVIAETTKEAHTALSALGSHPMANAAHRELAACYFDRPTLHSVPQKGQAEPAWIDQVLQFRRDGKLDPALRNLTDRVDEVRRRLLKDGHKNAAIQVRIAELLQAWLAESMAPLDRATTQLWLGETDQAIATINASLRANNQADQLIAAATTFQKSKLSDAKTAAVQWWDQLATGTKVGSPSWHRAKLASIDLLYHSGKKDEAVRRAKYILLTTSKLTAEQKAKYQYYQP